jgi:hypothetical protein
MAADTEREREALEWSNGSMIGMQLYILSYAAPFSRFLIRCADIFDASFDQFAFE